ncbi:MAG: DUF5678 domain-containing protein [Patescibacteria group bacterium]
MTITIEKFKKYENEWIALNEKTQKVVASGKNIAQVQKKAEKSKDKSIILKFIYPFNTYFAP